MTADAEMPRYRSHKEVGALKIAKVDQVLTKDNDDRRVHLMGYKLTFAEPEYAPRDVGVGLMNRYMAVPGDYLVVYEDGYSSISPAKAFEDGYTLIHHGKSEE